MTDGISRRGFAKSAAAAGVAASLASSKASGANERIRLAVIGTANRGGQLIKATLPHEDAEIVALCDVHQPALDRWNDQFGSDVTRCKDFRTLLDRQDIDAVIECVTTSHSPRNGSPMSDGMASRSSSPTQDTRYARRARRSSRCWLRSAGR